MEVITFNEHNEKHGVVWHTEYSEAQIFTTITRYRCLGGVPKTIKLHFDKTVTLVEVAQKVKNIINLDDDIFTMVAERDIDKL